MKKKRNQLYSHTISEYMDTGIKNTPFNISLKNEILMCVSLSKHVQICILKTT